MSTKAKIFALIDCNNFFVSCERVFRPDLWDRPVAVLSNNDGCIVARSNEVKALDIPMGAPYFKYEKELTTHNVMLFSANFPLYGNISQRIVTIISEASPAIETYSVDESFVELTHVSTIDYEMWARELQERILRWTGIPVSIGIASTKTLAKAASEYAKKHPECGGVHSVLEDEKRQALLEWLPAADVWGFGRRSNAKLREYGITTAAALALANPAWIEKTFSIRGRRTQIELQGTSVLGLDSERGPQKSLARTRSFGHTVKQYHELEGAIAAFTASISTKLRRADEVATVVVTFIQTGRHAAVQHSVAASTILSEGSADTAVLMKAALQNLSQIYDPDFGYKRAGVVLTGLVPTTAWQPSLLISHDDAMAGQRIDLMKAIDGVNAKYGTRLVTHATELLGDSQWHSKREKRSPDYVGDWRGIAIVKAH